MVAPLRFLKSHRPKLKSTTTSRAESAASKEEVAMAAQQANPTSESRRHETIAGVRVTIIKRGNVETVRGGPTCRWCGKPLRPKYLTERAAAESRHYFDKRPKHVPATFDEKRSQWLMVSTAFRVVSRVFEGSFGAYGDNHFCGLNCARDFAVALVEILSTGKVRLVDDKDEKVEPHKMPRKPR
jgi:hypothetical protein